MSVSEVLVGDQWAELAEVACGRRVLASDAAASGAPEAVDYRLVLDALSDGRADDADWLVRTTRRLRSAGGTACLSTLEGERQRVEARRAELSGAARRAEQFVRARLSDDEPLLRAARNDGWYTRLVRYAFGPESARRALVLWGKSGVGKSLALARIARMRPQGELEAALVSCTDIDDWPVAAEQLTAAAARFGARSVLLIDDLDVLESAERRKLVELAAGLRCRCVLVTNDWFARENWPLRAGRHKARFEQLRVYGAARATLSRYITTHYTALRTDHAALNALLDEADGDVRAALIAAELAERCSERAGERVGERAEDASAGGRLAPVSEAAKSHPEWVQSAVEEPVEGRDVRRQEALHYSLLRCARSAKPLREMELTHGDGDAETVGEVVFANAPRMIETGGGESREAKARKAERALEALAAAADCQSLAGVYDAQRRESGYAGVDGRQSDKQIHFALAAAVPLATVALGAGVSRQRVELRLEFPSRQLARSRAERSVGVARIARHLALVDRLGGAERAARALGEAGEPADTANRMVPRPGDSLELSDVRDVLLGAELRSPDRLAAALKERGKTSDALAAAIRRAAELGLADVDFWFVCSLVCSAPLPAERTLLAHWRRAKPRATTVAMASEPVKSRVTKRALAAAVRSPRPPVKRRDELKQSSDGRLRTLGDMFARMRNASGGSGGGGGGGE